MPKLDGTQIIERLRGRLDELRRGEEVAARDLRALLTDEQRAAMDAAWAEQQMLRKKKRARTKEEESELGWKTKRDIQIESYENAIAEAEDYEVEAWEKRLRDAEVRQGRIYFDELGKELAAGKDLAVAKNKANNALTQAELRRMDGQIVGHQSKRDREVREMEQEILKRAEATMTAEEREQMDLLNEHEKAVADSRKKR